MIDRFIRFLSKRLHIEFHFAIYNIIAIVEVVGARSSTLPDDLYVVSELKVTHVGIAHLEVDRVFKLHLRTRRGRLRLTKCTLL